MVCFYVCGYLHTSSMYSLGRGVPADTCKQTKQIVDAMLYYIQLALQLARAHLVHIRKI